MAVAKVMPVNSVIHLGMSRRHAIRQRLELSSDVLRYHHTLPQSSIASSHPVRSGTPPLLPPSPMGSPKGTPSLSGTLKKKKRVVFADDKGLALTAVRLFTVDLPESASDTDRIKGQLPVQPRTLRLRLGFPQPSADPLSYLGGLADSLVRLESCSLIGGSLTGKVRVCNISQQKAVNVRITFDSWRSHQDIPCTPQQTGVSTDLYVFNMPFPTDLKLQDHVEFRVLFRPGGGSTLLSDNNGGQNYRILVEVVEPEDLPLVQSRLFNLQSLKRPQTWPERRGQILDYLACHNPLSPPENMIIKPLSRQEMIISLC